MLYDHWAEIIINHLDEEDEFWRVDAWETGDEDEMGKVIAYIDNRDDHRILYIDPIARVDKHAQEEIKSFINELNKTEKE